MIDNDDGASRKLLRRFNPLGDILIFGLDVATLDRSGSGYVSRSSSSNINVPGDFKLRTGGGGANATLPFV